MHKDVDRLNQINATAQSADLSAQLTATPVYVAFEVAEDATGGLTVEFPYPLEVIDVIVHGTSTNSSGTLTLKRNGTDVTDAIDCATDGAVDRAATLDKDEIDFAEGDVATIVANGSGDRGIMYILGFRI